MNAEPDRSYLLSNRATELERLQVQSRVWEPAGHSLLEGLPGGAGRRALDVGCGVMGWLRVLSAWTGPSGSVVGTDIDGGMLEKARALVASEGLRTVTLVKDDLFASRLEPASFDLVHARFQLAPLGRAEEQIVIYRRLVAPGGWIVLEDPDAVSWTYRPDAPATARLIAWIQEGFRRGGGDFNAGRATPALLRAAGLAPIETRRVVDLPPGHPYLRLPLQFAASLRPSLAAIVGTEVLERLLGDAEAELARPQTHGTTFTLVQTVARVTP